MRIPLIAGNWKMNLDCVQGTELVKKIHEELGDTDVEVAVCCPAPLLCCMANELKDTPIRLGAQNMHWEDAGAFTGEVSAAMLKEAGVHYVILGHSERRQLFGETDEMINKKTKKALEKQLVPIVCIGETLEERETDKTFEVLTQQLKKDLDGLTEEAVAELVIAYEPVWAIGTGRTATPEQANEAVGFIRSQLEQAYGDDISEKIRILYGGSVKADNATEIMNCEEIDGALVGGASLKAEEFLGIIHF
ncbi:triose-phosphate isomerase [Anoxynatronum buryatiense]|uniref:Triosephosphate isomerase n=1 Tax=Anoxynatronum buryatiense TaxID=489973 RepID=A0AA45WSQ0_9CLOT|nr:triose-phosphate isomerase [Anoxynatronum buryatiense]SMP38912.1 triosephosphate isomerase [Anoxynatronum buryatiense]